MMKSLKKMNLAGVMLMATLLFISCEKEESPEVINEEQTFEVAELQASDESELISEEVLNIGEDVFATHQIAATAKGDYRSDYLPDCVTITTVVTSTSVEKTIDFGEGCELPNGNILSGIIYLSFEKDMELATHTLALALENFTFNAVAVEGSASIVRMRSNEDGNPQADASASYNATWPDGSTASFTGNRTREWIEGYGSGFWGDNVFLISGKGTFTGKMGNVFVKETISPLRRELACRFIVSGVLEISRNELTASLDFGDGSCDAKGMLTYPNGETEEIFLRRFLK
ncbi:MAG: hypothetical protein KJO94_05380 [Eudoraea sp.]|nr:hypothetical protein [Eudoraea sp.]MBT8312366.1 hypothetical protein [Eudoraea sp.]MBT8322893.1 hypothetical protein [Eudoraea sp.]NNJ38777.1 hypothetical protein [Flavobacteriaceae bacterium]NNJ40683.1 hypothetical protein [Eudoraea sp.]